MHSGRDEKETKEGGKEKTDFCIYSNNNFLH